MFLFANKHWQIGWGLAAATSALGALLAAVKLISLAVTDRKFKLLTFFKF